MKNNDKGPIERLPHASCISHKQLNQRETQLSKECLMDLPLRWRERARFRKNSASEKTIECLLSHPILTAKLFARSTLRRAPENKLDNSVPRFGPDSSGPERKRRRSTYEIKFVFSPYVNTEWNKFRSVVHLCVHNTITLFW